MRALTRPLVAGALVTAALLAAPAQAAPAAPAAPAAQGGIPGCDPVTACIADPFWLFRPCGPLIKCP